MRVDFLTFRTARPPLWVIISRCAPRGQLTRVCWWWHYIFFINARCNAVFSRLVVPRTLRARHPSTGITGCRVLTNLSGMIVHVGFSSIYPTASVSVSNVPILASDLLSTQITSCSGFLRKHIDFISQSESESLYSVLLQTQETSAKTYLVAVAEATWKKIDIHVCMYVKVILVNKSKSSYIQYSKINVGV